MARLRTDVPRARRGRTTLPGAAHPNPLLESVGGGPTPYVAVAGGFHPEEEAARLPTPHVVVAPNGQPAAVRTPHPTLAPVAGPGQTVITPTPQLGTVAPTTAIRTPTEIHQEHQRRLTERALNELAPLNAPSFSPKAAEALGGLFANPVGTAAQIGSALIPKETPQDLLKQIPTMALQQTFQGNGDTIPQERRFAANGEASPAIGINEKGDEEIIANGGSQGVTNLAKNALAAIRPGPPAQATPVAAAPKPTNVLTALQTGNPQDPLGGHTLGNVTQQQLVAAAKAGTLQKNAKGQLTTPEGRQLLHGLLTAHKGAEAARALPAVHADGSLEPNEIGALLVEEGKKLGLNLSRHDVAEGIGVAEAESSGDYAANVAQIPELGAAKAHIGLYSEEESGFGDQQERENPRSATRLALEGFARSGNSWNPDWVHWQEIQGENETGADRAPEYNALASELLKGGKAVEPVAVKALVNAQAAARADGINPTPWNGDVTGGKGNYVTIRADAKGALNWAESAVGTQQGEPRQLHWAAITHGPEDPWCAEFVGASALRQGLTLPEDPAYAGSYLNWKDGTNLGTDTSKLKPGDYLVFGQPGGEAEHIGIYKGDGEMISGNFSNEVALSGVEEEIGAAGLQGIVRPKYKGGTIKVKAGSLPGSSPGAVPGNEGSTGTSGGEVTTGAAPVETVPAAATSSNGAAATREAALANFTAPAAPNIGGNIFESGQPSEAEEAIRLLTQASARSRI